MEPREYETLGSLEDHFWWYRGLHRLILERIEGCLADRRRSRTANPALRILDAGCGTGGMVRKLTARYPEAEIYAFDFSPHALEATRRRSDRSARGRGIARASVSAIPFPTGYFDLVVSLDVLYHAGVRDDLEALCEFERVLRPGGNVVLNLPAFESLRSTHDRAIHTARRYRSGLVRDRLVRAGLTPVRVHYWNGFLFPALAVVRWARRGDTHADGPPAPSDVRPLPRVLNRSLEFALTIERAWLRVTGLPFGLSVLAVARRPDPRPDPAARPDADPHGSLAGNPG